MSKTFYSDAAKKHYYCCLIALAVLLGIIVFNSVIKSDSIPRRPEAVAVTKNTTLEARVNDKKELVKVKSGAKVKVLGAFDGAYAFKPARLWVELEDGTRGEIACDAFDVEYKAQMDDSKQMKKVTLKAMGEDEATCVLKDGTEIEVDFDELYPQWPRSWDVKYLASPYTTFYISKEKFERKFIGSTFEKNDDRYRPAIYVVNKDGAKYATYPIWVLDTSNGMRYKYTVKYDSEGVAQSYEVEDTEKRAKFLLRFLPFVGPIADVPVLSGLIEGSMYTLGGPGRESSSLILKIIVLLLAAIYLVFVFLWVYATPMIPVLLIGVLMHYPKTFYALSNGVLNKLIWVVSIVSSYVWLCLLIAWGLPSLLVIPIFFVPIFVTSFVSAPLTTDSPCGRCLGCRNIETMEFVDSVYVREYEKWMRESEYVKKISEHTRKWKTWTDVTTRWSDGSTTHSKENEQEHSETIRTHLYDDYKVLYNVKVYQNNYECVACGQKEHNFSEDYTEIDRKYLGTHMETTID